MTLLTPAIGAHVRIKLDEERVGEPFFSRFNGQVGVVIRYGKDERTGNVTVDVAPEHGVVTTFELDEIEGGRYVRVWVPQGKTVKVV